MRSAVDEDADVIGASVLSGSHVELARQIISLLDDYGARDRIKLVVGGIIPPGDVPALKELGVERVFTPSDYELIDIMESIADLVQASVDDRTELEIVAEPAAP